MKDFKKYIDQVIYTEIENNYIAGANFRFIHKGQTLYANSYGYANRENNKVMNENTIFRMFSMTKPVTAVATMILVERGMIDLTEAISYYLPEFKDPMVYTLDGEKIPANREITIYDLLNMTSEIPYPDQNHPSGKEMGILFEELKQQRIKGNPANTREYVKRIAQIPLVCQPGTKWLYGLSADILGALIEVVANKSYGQFLQDEIFEPLHMVDTGFYVPAEKEDRFASNYEYHEIENKLIAYENSHLGEYYKEDIAFESGGAGLVSTIEDYSHFAQMMVNGGIYQGIRILSEQSIQFMIQDRLTLEQKVDYNWDSNRGYGYGCLMRNLIDQGEAGTIATLQEFGWDGWTGNYVTMNREDEVIILYFIQRCGAGTTLAARKIKNICYGAIGQE